MEIVELRVRVRKDNIKGNLSYVVPADKKGLEQIAAKFYEDGAVWPILYDINKKKNKLTSPVLIHPGDVLTLPKYCVYSPKDTSVRNHSRDPIIAYPTIEFKFDGKARTIYKDRCKEVSLKLKGLVQVQQLGGLTDLKGIVDLKSFNHAVEAQYRTVATDDFFSASTFELQTDQAKNILKFRLGAKSGWTSPSGNTYEMKMTAWTEPGQLIYSGQMVFKTATTFRKQTHAVRIIGGFGVEIEYKLNVAVCRSDKQYEFSPDLAPIREALIKTGKVLLVCLVVVAAAYIFAPLILVLALAEG
jgi:hypothetical protein